MSGRSTASVRGLATALLLLVGCRPTARSRADADAGSAPVASDPNSPFVRFDAAGVPSYTLVRERGVGIVHLDPGPVLAGRVSDTLEARDRPEPGAGVLARLVLDTVGVYTFEARAGLLDTPGALEFGYGEVGFPILDHGPEGWERVYLGTAPGGAVVSGWARARPALVGVTLWDELIPGQPIFFALPPDSIRFHAAPDSAEVSFAVKPDDYILWPIDVRGDWMRVRAVTPSDYCAAPVPGGPPARLDTLWIRWRTESGRPRVWFYTRGC